MTLFKLLLKRAMTAPAEARSDVQGIAASSSKLGLDIAHAGKPSLWSCLALRPVLVGAICLFRHLKHHSVYEISCCTHFGTTHNRMLCTSVLLFVVVGGADDATAGSGAAAGVAVHIQPIQHWLLPRLFDGC